MKTAVVIHGHHLQADSWEDVVWGDPQSGRLGRAARGLIEALTWDADVIFFPTGASERDGKKEGEVTFETAKKRIAEISEFARMGESAAHEWLEKRAMLELTSQNTESEIAACAQIAIERGMERLVLVSSPTHILRAHKIALSLIESGSLVPFRHSLYSVASDVSYAGASVDDVVIVEPPHRPDRPKVYMNETLKSIQILRKSEHAEELNGELCDVIEKFTNKYNESI